MTDDSILLGVSFMLSRWANVLHAVKNISTMNPLLLLKNSSVAGIRHFITKLEEKRDELLDDYIQFIRPNFKVGKDTFTGMCVRYDHRVVWLALNRLIYALNRLWGSGHNNITMRDLIAYFSHLCIPTRDIYHEHALNGVAADLLHEVFILSNRLHMEKLFPLASTKTPPLSTASIPSCGNDMDPECALIYSGVNEVEKLLKYAALIHSYPVVPENLAGSMICTMQSMKRISTDIDKSGVDSRSNVLKMNDPRVCVACKVESINVGLTDVDELHLKMPCRCLFDAKQYVSSEFYEKSHVWRAAAITRSLLMNHDLIPSQHGCNCDKHRAVFATKLCQLKKALDSVNVVS